MDEFLRWLKIGAGLGAGLAILAVVAWLCYLAYDTRQAALEGRGAMQFIRQVNSQPAAQTPPATPPAPKKE